MGSPSLLDAQSARVLARHNDFAEWLSGHAVGGLITDGGTTQGSGASTAPNFDIDSDAIIQALIDGEVHGLAAQIDADADAGTGVDFAATSGKSVVFACVLETGAANDTPAIQAVAGAVADSGEEVAPTDTVIEAAVGHSYWIPLSLVTVERTADTTVTVTVDDSWRYRAVEEHTGDLAETEADFQTAAGVP